MKIKSFFKATIHESLLIGILLALVGGFLDIYTYILKGNVFANAQTGNMVLMGLKLANQDYLGAFYYLIPISAFFLGIIISEYIKHKLSKVQYIEWQHLIIIIEIIILVVIAFLPKNVPNLPYASTMCTGNLRSAGQKLASYLFKDDKDALSHCFRYLIIIASFISGAIIATILVSIFDHMALLFCCLILIIILLILVY